MPDIPHDRPDQLEKVLSGLLQGEQLIAVYDCIGIGTGFIGVTDKRIILQDNSFVGKKVAITSVPYAQIRAISVVSNKSWTGNFFSTSGIAIDSGARIHHAEFRGTDKARHIHDYILWKIT